jgi:hypothetical protein
VQAGRTPEKCVLFENLFLGALLAFLSQFVQEGKKKSKRTFHFEASLKDPKCSVKEGRRGRRKRREREGQELNNRMCSHNLD